MSIYYFDSSALVKRYIPETGSEWIRDIFTNPDTVCNLAKIGIVEVANTFARKQREGVISEKEYQRLLNAFLKDCRTNYETHKLSPPIISSAIRLSKKYPLKAYDAVQLATAHSFNSLLSNIGASPLTFLSADNQLLRAASNEGLKADNPNEH